MTESHTKIISSDVELVRLADAHLSSVQKIENAAHSHPWKTSQLSNFDGRGACNFAVIDSKGQILGYFYAQNIVGEVSLLNIAVDPSLHGNGVGRLLLEALIEKSEQVQAESIWLEVRESNLAAIRLYESLDFNEVDRRRDYYPIEGGKEDAIVMCLTLGFGQF
jgi:ribosomal-protein-alanine N-acetyltransferase